MHSTDLPCTKCGDTLPPTEFYAAPRNTKRSGLHSWCKTCTADDTRTRRATQSAEDKERLAVANRARARRKRLAKYGLTADDYQSMMASQNGVCAICERPETVRQPHRIGGGESLAIDHDHATGKVRGLLCMTCNTAIGKLNDDPNLLRVAARYLEQHQ
jgi:hypothetical protein